MKGINHTRLIIMLIIFPFSVIVCLLASEVRSAKRSNQHDTMCSHFVYRANTLSRLIMI